jgi:thiamine-phosphate pyrophosphorylase
VRGLYAIADVDFLAQHQLAPLAFVDALLPAGPAAIQLRAKSLGARETLALLRAIRARCAPLGIPVFANDRPDLAVLAECAGVHLGQTDLAVMDARRLSPGLAIGISTHRLEQVDGALLERPAYVAFGPVFATGTKSDAEVVVGLPALAEAARRCHAVGVPLIAIGGLTLERVALVAESADGGAMISGLLPAGGVPMVAANAFRLHALLGGSRPSPTGAVAGR